MNELPVMCETVKSFDCISVAWRTRSVPSGETCHRGSAREQRSRRGVQAGDGGKERIEWKLGDDLDGGEEILGDSS